MTLQLKQLRPGEEAVLGKIADEVFDQAIDAARLRDFLADERHCLQIFLDGDLVVAQARGVILRHPDRGLDLFIDNLGVAPAYKRRGLGTRLIAALKDWGRAQGCADFWIATEADNAEARAFYASLGLKATDVVMYEGSLKGD